MTVALDLAPRIASFDPVDFPVPTGREEEWRFTPMDQVSRFMEVQPDAGCFVAESSPYVRIVSAADCGDGWIPTDRPSAIARAQATRAVHIAIPAEAEVEGPVVVSLRGEAQVNYGHIVVSAGHHSRATVVLLHDMDVDGCGAIVCEVGEAARLTVVSVIDGPANRVHLWQWHTRIGRDAEFVGAQATMAGEVVRVRPSVDYDGPGGRAELLGAFLVQGRQHVEHRVFVDHDQPHCSSSVTYKGALSGEGARSVWIGDILVRRDAIGIDTYEVNRNLLLDDGPRADSVPNLELETGDVASAGHASATGRFDDEQVFYLQARGIPESIARLLIVRGFFADVLGRIGDPHWTEALMSRIEVRLGMGETAT